MKFKFAAILLGALLWAAMPAHADTVTYDFGGCPMGHTCPGGIGTSQTYTSGAFTITAYGFNLDGSATPLYVKMSGGDETGLGLARKSDFEIQTDSMIQLDFTNLANAGILSGMLTLGSVQGGEGYTICESNTIGLLGGSCFSGTLDMTAFPISWSKADPILSITANSHDVLLVSESSTFTQTPEPATLTLVGTGLLFAIRRFRSSAASR
jgi:hypothetical protein